VELNLTILLALLPALLTAATLLATLASGLLLLLTGFLLAALLAALLLAALLLPALLHITHLVVRHGELSFAEEIRAKISLFAPALFRSEQMWLAAMPEPRCTHAVSPNYRRAGRFYHVWCP
jgi:hypothetical protein